MTATRFSPAPEQKPLIPPTEIDNQLRHRRIQGEVQDENAYILHGAAGHAGLFSNVADLLQFAGEVLAGSSPTTRHGSPKLFTRETVETFAQRQGPDGSSRALGWDTPSQESSAGQYFSRHSIGHLGFSGCSLWIDLDASVAAVLLANRTWPDRQCQLIREIRPSFHDAVRVALSGQQLL
jgi:CubicO group peptidase (beta-lactamase class C family)